MSCQVIFQALGIRMSNRFHRSNDGELLASGSSNGVIRIWSFETGAMLASVTAHSGNVSDITFSSDDRQVISTGLDGAISIWCLFKQ